MESDEKKQIDADEEKVRKTIPYKVGRAVGKTILAGEKLEGKVISTGTSAIKKVVNKKNGKKIVNFLLDRDEKGKPDLKKRARLRQNFKDQSSDHSNNLSYLGGGSQSPRSSYPAFPSYLTGDNSRSPVPSNLIGSSGGKSSSSPMASFLIGDTRGSPRSSNLIGYSDFYGASTQTKKRRKSHKQTKKSGTSNKKSITIQFN
jgi:hypothetical protein